MFTASSLEIQSRSTSTNWLRNIPFALSVFFLVAAVFPTHAAACTKRITTGVLPPGDPNNICDLEVTNGEVIVDSTSMPAAWANVNIWGGGSLCFIDQGKNLDFWAANILVENDGALTNGVDDPINNNLRCILGPFGSKGGTLTIHLYGASQKVGTGAGDGGVGITCKADDKNQCGIPDTIWNSNKMDMANMNPKDCTSSELPGLYGHVNDCFYQYNALDFDDGKDTNGHVGYVGYKVLAVTYNGRLKLYGTKGVSPQGNNAPCKPGAACPQKADSGRSWGRLLGTVKPGAITLVLDRQVFWQAGDQIVLTTTDYIPGHSEQLTLSNVTRNSNGTTTLTLDSKTAVIYDHNGETYDLTSVPAGVGPDPDPNVKCTAGQARCIETRAAIGLLTRNIRIVSGCDAYGQDFPDPGKDCTGAKADTSYYFGGQVIARQGLDLFELSGVELKNMGEGGRIMHYPIHFHMARAVPLLTFVEDSSIWDSMNRWITIHATQNVELARNVGYLSIGHGFYLEDGTETGNSLIANLGVMARGAIDNPQNPRQVPGILAGSRSGEDTPRLDTDEVPFHTDVEHPSVFWITNGENFFSYNTAAGANTCGVCYWLVPAANSGMSRLQHWEHYAAEQEYRTRTDPKTGKLYDDLTYAATTPLGSFVGNSCVAAQSSFLTIGDTAACKAISHNLAGMPAIENPLAPKFPAEGDPIDGFEAADGYYPRVAAGGARTATVCPVNGQGSQCSTGKSYISPCGYNADSHKAEDNCAITQLDRYTSSFNWADTNLSAIWLRKQWYLVSNSAISDVQNGGLTFVSGGGYSYADEIPGYWALAHKSVFVGNTQLLKEVNNIPTPDNPFASNAGPFNPATHDTLKCVHPDNSMCISPEQGIFFGISNFAMNQRLFNIYDGPSYQSSNAYMDITTTTLAGCLPGQGGDVCADSHFWGNGLAQGIPLDSTAPSGAQCYLPNAAIAWKQPNGFYYPPAFRSTNLYFNYDKANPYRRVDIRHFVIEPLFEDGTLNTNEPLVEARYCTYSRPITNVDGVTLGTMFQSYTDIDRQTELTDEDGSLTGLRGPIIGQFQMPTISVNKDPFFRVPIETTECSSDLFDNMPPTPLGGRCAFQDDQLCGTANTSPYDYVTTVVIPQTVDAEWSSTCETQSCPGVPLYRLDLLKNESTVSLIRMAGQGIGQRSNLTVNHGRYFLDTTVSEATQDPFACRYWTDKMNKCGNVTDKNVFLPGDRYYLFFLYARPEISGGPPPTKQVYQVYVGEGFSADTDLVGIRVDQGQVPPKVTEVPFPASWSKSVSADGILTVDTDMSATALPDFASAYKRTRMNHCAPATYCKWTGDADTGTCECAHSGDAECTYACSNWAGKDINCPESDGSGDGCYGFGFKLSANFKADDSGATKAAAGGKCLVKSDSDWNSDFTKPKSNPNPNECDYSTATIPQNFCDSAAKAKPKALGRLP